MVLRSNQHHEEVEWRSPDVALALDLNLMEDVFRRLARQRRDANNRLKTRDHHAHNNNDNQTSHTCANPTQTQVLGGDEAPLPPPSAPSDGSPSFHPDMLFSKSDVLVTLEKSQGFLQKRPMLRMLHTSLACVSFEKEGASVEGFVRFRVKERTLSFAMAKDRLLKIFSKTQSTKDFEAQVQLFKEQARAKSLWCVRDWKSWCSKPSQYYGVHVIPIKPKTQKQLDEEHKVLETVAAGVVNNALQLCIEKIVDRVIAAHRPATEGGGKRSARSRTPHSASQEDGENGSQSRNARKFGGGASKLALRARAKRGQEEAEGRRKQLRLQILAPNIEQTSLLLVKPVSTALNEPADQLQQDQSENNNDGDADLEEGSSQLNTIGDPSVSPSNKRKSQARSKQSLLLLLATVEANGDIRIAERLLSQTIAKSGFQRALDQAENLRLAADDHWGLLKIWKTVYRNHTMQSL